MALLEVSGLQVAYGPVTVLHGVDLTVDEGSIVALLGANGSGKSTLLRAVLGLLKAREGSVTFDGTEVLGRPPHKIHQLGLAWAPQGRQTLATLTVRENLLMGGFSERDSAQVQVRMQRMYDLFPVLNRRRDQLAGSLSGGEQQMLSIARALMSEPRLLLLDEPSIGLAPKVIREVFDLAVHANAAGTAVLLVEQNARQALRVANRVAVLETGRIVATGEPADIEASETLRRAYLGA